MDKTYIRHQRASQEKSRKVLQHSAVTGHTALAITVAGRVRGMAASQHGCNKSRCSIKQENKMKRIILIALLLANVAIAKDVYVHGHTRNDGTYVQPHYRTAPDNDIQNNYSTRGNVNPYTGQQGTVNPYSQPTPQYQYQQPQQHCTRDYLGNVSCY
jgi:hypothetical protein